MIDYIKNLSIIVAGIVALVTFVTGTLQYIRQGRQIRASQFIEMRRRFLEDDNFRVALSLLATDSSELIKIPIQDRRNLVGFIEEVALLVDSRLLKPDVAYYMFGYYAILIDRSDNFWNGLEREGLYWRVFRDFVQKLKEIEPKLRAAPSNPRF